VLQHLEPTKIKVVLIMNNNNMPKGGCKKLSKDYVMFQTVPEETLLVSAELSLMTESDLGRRLDRYSY
jgi:hypothetical protein